jgi:hypothetical protein
MQDREQGAAVAVGMGTRVYLNFSLSLEDGAEIDNNFGADPVSFAVGDGSLLPGFESLLLGMRPGERTHVLRAAGGRLRSAQRAQRAARRPRTFWRGHRAAAGAGLSFATMHPAARCRA